MARVVRMQTGWVWPFLVSILAPLHYFASPCAGADEIATDRRALEELVRQALAAELSGDDAARRKGLRAVAAVFPDYAPAHWHAGELQLAGEWLSVTEAERRAVESGVIAQYRRRRDQCPATVADHVELARWCRRQTLSDQEALHWWIVLRFDPSHREARGRLNVREIGGMLVTATELEGVRDVRQAQERASAEWTPRAKQWKQALESDDPAARNIALTQLQSVDDAAAIESVAAVFATAQDREQFEVLRVMGTLLDDRATEYLLVQALAANSPAVRDAAIRALGDRPRESFVPVLLGSFQALAEFSYDVSHYANVAGYGFRLEQEGVRAHYAYQRSHIARLSGWNESTPRVAERFARALGRDIVHVAQVVDQSNARVESWNARIMTVLRGATGEQRPATPRDWLAWWEQLNELESEANKPTIYAQYQTNSVHVRRSTTYALMQDSAAKQVAQIVILDRATGRVIGRERRQKSCFLAGTMVASETGFIPIERIRTGDRVLAQDPESGELTYKLVLDTTLRSPSRSLRIQCGGEEIAATLGHPLWVTGLGWRMAKQVEVGQQLHGVRGSRTITAIEAGPTAEAYNLVVADFSTYCIGQNRFLVHDNQPRRITEAVLPGHRL